MDYDEDAVLDPRAKARLEKQRELESDLHNATELFGSATAKGECVFQRKHEVLFSLSPMSSKTFLCARALAIC